MAQRKYLTLYPWIASCFDPELNGVPACEVPLLSRKKYWWRCANGHIQYKEACKMTDLRKTHSNSISCDECRSLGYLKPEVAKRWHPILNGNLTPTDVSIGSHKKVWWLCPQGHTYDALVCENTRGRYQNGGCPYCCSFKIDGSNSLARLYPEIAIEWHPTKNGSLSPEQMASHSKNKVWWQCKNREDHTWYMTVADRTSKKKYGCPICRDSKGEKRVSKILNELGLIYRRQFPLKTMRNSTGSTMYFDFALAVGARRGLIEYQGQQHYMPSDWFGGIAAFEKTQQRDHIKRNICQELNVPLLEIPHWNFDKTEELVTQFVEFLKSPLADGTSLA